MTPELSGTHDLRHASRMYEFGVAAALLERVSLLSVEHDLRRVRAIGIRLGELSGVDPRALSFGFEMLAKDTPFAGVRLDVENESSVCQCQDCRREFSAAADYHCPFCGSHYSTCLSGEGLNVSYVELEEGKCL